METGNMLSGPRGGREAAPSCYHALRANSPLSRAARIGLCCSAHEGARLATGMRAVGCSPPTVPSAASVTDCPLATGVQL